MWPMRSTNAQGEQFARQPLKYCTNIVHSSYSQIFLLTDSRVFFRICNTSSPACLPLPRYPLPRPVRKTQKRCALWDDKKSAKDNDCSGKIKSGELVVKDWVDPPLHLVCSKLDWRKTINEFLRQKKQLHDLGSTAEKEATQPSAKVPDHLKDF